MRYVGHGSIKIGNLWVTAASYVLYKAGAEGAAGCVGSHLAPAVSVGLGGDGSGNRRLLSYFVIHFEMRDKVYRVGIRVWCWYEGTG